MIFIKLKSLYSIFKDCSKFKKYLQFSIKKFFNNLLSFNIFNISFIPVSINSFILLEQLNLSFNNLYILLFPYLSLYSNS